MKVTGTKRTCYEFTTETGKPLGVFVETERWQGLVRFDRFNPPENELSAAFSSLFGRAGEFMIVDSHTWQIIRATARIKKDMEGQDGDSDIQGERDTGEQGEQAGVPSEGDEATDTGRGQSGSTESVVDAGR